MPPYRFTTRESLATSSFSSLSESLKARTAHLDGILPAPDTSSAGSESSVADALTIAATLLAPPTIAASDASSIAAPTLTQAPIQPISSFPSTSTSSPAISSSTTSIAASSTITGAMSSISSTSSPSVSPLAASSQTDSFLSNQWMKSHLAIVLCVFIPIGFLILWAIALQVYRYRAKKRRRAKTNALLEKTAKLNALTGFPSPLLVTTTTAAPPPASASQTPTPILPVHSGSNDKPRYAAPMPEKRYLGQTPSLRSTSHLPAYVAAAAGPIFYNNDTSSTLGSRASRRLSTPLSLKPGSAYRAGGGAHTPGLPHLPPALMAAPVALTVPPICTARVIAEYDPELPDELPVVLDRQMEVLVEYKDAWVLCRDPVTTRQGMVPRDCLDLREKGIGIVEEERSLLKR